MSAGRGVNAYILDSSGNPFSSQSGGVLIAGYDYTSNQIRLVSVDMSGQINIETNLTVTANVSGQPVVVSGQPVTVSGNVVKISGETVATQIPTLGRTRGIVQVSSNSGGDLLASGDVKSVTVRMGQKASGGTNDASGFVLVGYDIAGERPFVGANPHEYNSGYGFILFPGDGYTVEINNMNKIRVVSKLSGEYVSYIGNQY